MGVVYGTASGTDSSSMPDYTAEELATADAGDWDMILAQFGVTGDYEKYFVQFDQQEIADIQANFNNQLDQMDLKSKSIADTLQNTYETKQRETVGQVEDIGVKQSDFVSHRGFESGADITRRFQKEKADIVSGTSSALEFAGDTADMEQKGIRLQKEGAKIQKDMDIRSAYKTYQDQFYSQLGLVEQMKDDDDVDPDDGGGCCFIVLEVENKEKLDVYIRKYRDEMLNDTNRKGYYKLAQVVVPLMRKYNIVKWLFQDMTKEL